MQRYDYFKNYDKVTVSNFVYLLQSISENDIYIICERNNYERNEKFFIDRRIVNVLYEYAM